MSHFPTPYEDEVLYSVLARYHIRSGNDSFKSTMDEIFGSVSITSTMDLPAHINDLVRNLPVLSKYTAKDFIYKHTLYPYYAVFLPVNRAQRVFKSMKEGSGGGIHTRVGLMASSIKLNRYFKFCPCCIKADEKEFGELYWHRTHQIPGVLVCPKHHVLLEDSKVPIRGHNKHHYQAANEDNCVFENTIIRCSEKTFAHLISIADSSLYLLGKQLSSKPVDWFQAQYINALKNMGLVSVKGRVSQKGFAKEFKHFYGEELLNLVQSNYSEGNEATCWLSEMVRECNKAKHPVRHLLLAEFFGVSIHNLFLKKVEYKPFGEGPWPCLNIASDHYRDLVIKDVEVSHGAGDRKPVGTFSCDCGFVYTRSAEMSKFKARRVKCYGGVWEARLMELLGHNLGLRETARQLNADPNTIKSYTDKLGLEAKWQRRGGKVSRDEVIAKKSQANNEKYKQRQEWLKRLNVNPDVGKTELRSDNKALFAWLYRHDRCWLRENSPKKKDTIITNNRTDWEVRDEDIFIRVKKAVNEILCSDVKPRRISVSLIGSVLAIRGLLEKHLDKLPKTRAYMEEVKETDSGFRLRRLKWAAQQLEQGGEEVSAWRVLRKANIRKEYVSDLEDVLQQITGKE